MGEPTKKKLNGDVGRILDYELSNSDEKVVNFKRRVKEQIDVLRIAIKNGSVNDAKISENYANKAERFLTIPYFSEKSNKNKRVHDLKSELKLTVAIDKEMLTVIENWLIQKRRNKVILASKYAPINAQHDFSYFDEMTDFYNADMDFLNTYRTTYVSECIVVKRLLTILKEKEIIEDLAIKNSWKVETLKKAFHDNRDKLKGVSDEEYIEIMLLPYFKYKKYLTMEVSKLKEVLGIRAEALTFIENWIEELYYIARHENENLYNLDSEFIEKANLSDIFYQYDKFIGEWTFAKKDIDKEYSLYRFGQGLVESDIFDTLYK